jgi:8-oxo-dGTP diphosphatase
MPYIVMGASQSNGKYREGERVMRQVRKRPGAITLLVNGAGEVLLQLRDPDPGIPYPDTWGLPGGGVEPGETSEQAVRRELVEEIAFVAGELTEVGRCVTPEGFAMTLFAGGIDVPIEALECNEGVALRYVAPEALRGMTVAPWLKAVLLGYFFGEH